MFCAQSNQESRSLASYSSFWIARFTHFFFKFNIGMVLREAIVLANRLIFPFAKGSTIATLLILTYVAYICARYFFQEKFKRSPTLEESTLCP